MNLQRVEQIEKDSILHVLQYAIGPSETSLKKAVLFYGRNKGAFYKFEETACIGIEIIGANKARICHIAVVPQYRHKGIALQMIKEVLRIHQLTYVEAETDKEAVEFYMKSGFQVKNLGEKYPGIERFHCYLEK
ncbi:GNAT family N-acetyltransferase [Bacillus albus]|uniref:GNAT family N-acetyltransferase n=1 Tax=Bacillus cereus group TaxID=86661 RepID=UPI0022E20ABE|nr:MULTISPECIES: GNAT family N-acetyltransferase [Bacillus cereus group]MDA2025511.1 GNAT family N-acetyltransferase [Bacillus cereus group sp. Bcc03]MDA2216271.1 GNAT family N-acetyltransferase [Bacillus cereus group sp. Bc228]MDA2230225.1 GNAT family N-acetyltransferase [Bacillus cereus group sp. Bc227]MDA2260268.1 GNAT family N-acetyltransferase [Bacillus cereus group sp. Bc200]MDA2324391.1 GNAT family N-acetyltransferase [Bacillus cereus group sp. Bc177]